MRIGRSIHAGLFILGMAFGGLLCGCDSGSDKTTTTVAGPTQEQLDSFKKTQDAYKAQKTGKAK
jgi:hypothetical protein